MRGSAIGSVAAPLGATQPISWPVFTTVFLFGSVLLWADRSNFSIAMAAWAKEYDWNPSASGLMLSGSRRDTSRCGPRAAGSSTDRCGPLRTVCGTMAGWSL